MKHVCLAQFSHYERDWMRQELNYCYHSVV